MTEQEITSLIESKLNTGKYTAKTLIIAVLTSFFIGCIVGSYITKNYWPTLNTEVKTVAGDPIVTEKVKVVTDTKIAYVPKETIHYIDKSTGQQVTAKESTDVQFDVAKPKVSVKVNGQEYKFDLLQGETQKFQEGKVAMQQTSNICMDIKVPTIDLTRHNVLTAGAMITNGNISPAIGYTGSVGRVGAYQFVAGKDGQYVGLGIKF